MDIASLALGTVLGGIISWGISAYFYSKSNSDLRQTLEDYRRREDKKDTLDYFELMLTQGTWSKEFLNDRTTWICNQKITLKIVQGDAFEPFDEEWTRPYPDKQAKRCEVELKVNESTIKSLTFIHLDGHRIVVPMPRRIVGNGKPLYFWEKDSLEYKVGKIIGEYYKHKTIEGIAKISDVTIVSGQERD